MRIQSQVHELCIFAAVSQLQSVVEAFVVPLCSYVEEKWFVVSAFCGGAVSAFCGGAREARKNMSTRIMLRLSLFLSVIMWWKYGYIVSASNGGARQTCTKYAHTLMHRRIRQRVV